MGDVADDMFNEFELAEAKHLCGDCGGGCELCIAEELAGMDDFDSIQTKEELSMSNETVKGIVEKINCNKSGYYGILIGDVLYGGGKHAPKFNEGDEVSFEYTMNGKYANMEFKTVEVHSEGNSAPKSTGSSSSNGGGGGKPTEAYWENKDRRIALMSCRNSAVALISAVVTAEALTLPTKKSDRFDVVMELANNLTNDYFKELYDEEFSILDDD